MRTRIKIKSWLSALVALAMVLSSGPVAGKVLEPAELKTTLAASPGAEIAGSWLEFARRGDFKTLQARIQSLLDSSKPPLVREQALYNFVVGLRKLPLEATPDKLLQRLTDYDSQVFYWHPESRGTYKLPVFDVAGAAQGTLRFAERKRASIQAALLLQQKSADFWSAFNATKSVTQRQGFLDALRKAPVEQLRPLDKSTAPRNARAGAILALRLGDAALARQVIDTADPLVARQVVEGINGRFSTRQALDLLQGATRRDALASAAVGQLGVLAKHYIPARIWLMENMGDPSIGSSAAASLSRLANPALTERVIAELQAGAMEAATRNRLLFLHLTGGQPAGSALRQFANNPARPAHLRAEVKRWLGM